MSLGSRRPRSLLSLAIAAVMVAASPSSARSQDILLVGGNVMDPTNREVRVQHLLIRDGRIAETPPMVPEGFEGEVIDVTGQWILPTFVDLHTHSFGNQAPVEGVMEFQGTPVVAERMLYAGVGAFLDLFSLEDMIFAMRDSQRELGTLSADIFAAGPCFTAPEGHCSEYGIPTRIIRTAEEAEAQVTELAAKAPDVIKLVYSQTGRMPSVDRATMTGVVSTAKRLGIPTVIHVGSWDDVRHVALAGADAVTHVPTDEIIPDDVLTLMVDRGVASIPTLAVQLGVSDLRSNPEQLESELAENVTTPAVLDAYRTGELMPAAAAWSERQVASREIILESVRRMHDAGVPVWVGTDSGNLGTIQGWSVHHELMKLVEAGLSEWDALAAGTVEGAAFLDLEYGVTVGARANLLVLQASPLEDIRNTQRIAEVIHRGQRIARERLAVP